MPIEIKELVVKFTIEQPRSDTNKLKSKAAITDKETSDIVKQCTEAVLNRLSRFEER